MEFDATERRIGCAESYFNKCTYRRFPRCLAHIINLASQAVIAAQSQSPHYDPAKPDAHEPNTSGLVRDEVGLVRAISVKERSSSQRKQRFRDIQQNAGVALGNIKTLIVDMKVRWSSTFMMLNRAYNLRKVSNYCLCFRQAQVFA